MLCSKAKDPKVSERVNRRNTILQLITPNTNHTPSNSHLLNHRRWCHLANKLKPHCDQANRRYFHVWNSYHQHSYSRQRRTIGSFSAIGRLLGLWRCKSLCNATSQTVTSLHDFDTSVVRAAVLYYRGVTFVTFQTSQLVPTAAQLRTKSLQIVEFVHLLLESRY